MQNGETAEVFISGEQNGKNGKLNPINGIVIEMNQRNSNGHSNGNAVPGI